VTGRIAQGRRTAVTLLASLTLEGFGPGFQFAGALDRPVFEADVERILGLALRPGQTVILANRSVHKSARARQLIEAAGCALRFPPTYSPDFNPIEQAVSALKARRRQAEARTTEAGFAATHAAYPTVTAAHARSFYRDAGYKL
jgi:transposase